MLVVIAPAGRKARITAGPFTETAAATLIAGLRAQGWAASDRPEAGGLLDAWHRHTAPVDVDGRLTVCFPWSEFKWSDGERGANPIEIDPHSAFGAGSHPSTRLLLEMLVRHLAVGDRVLDVGCGSGVLAIAAARLGAGRVVGVDVRADAVTATFSNATRNSVTIDASVTPLADVAGVFDAVVANIEATTLVALAPELVAHVAPGGWLGVAGISPAQVSVVRAALGGGVEVSAGEWSALRYERSMSSIRLPNGSST